MAGDYPPAVLQRGRKVGSATAAGLPITVSAGALASITIPFTNIVSDLQSSHTRIRASVLGCSLTTDSGGTTKINIQSANLQNGDGTVAAPLNTGSSLGAYNGAVLNGSLEWDTDDISQLSHAQIADLKIILVVLNTDAGGHNVTDATAVLLIESTQYADLYRATV